MGYARHIGRVGALAVTLGVGVAIASTPGVARADTTDASPKDNSPSTASSQAAGKTPPSKSTPTRQSPSRKSPSKRTTVVKFNRADSDTATSSGKKRGPRTSVGSDQDKDERKNPVGESNNAVSQEKTDENKTPTVVDETPNPKHPQAKDETPPTVKGRSTERKAWNAPRRPDIRVFTARRDDVKSSLRPAARVAEKTSAKLNADKRADTATQTTFGAASSAAAANKVTQTTTTAAVTAPAPTAAAATPTATTTTPERRTSVVSLVTDLLGAALQPLLYGGGSGGPPPLQLPSLMAVIGAVRDEIERIALPRQTPPRPQQTSKPVYPDPPTDPTKQHVLVIGIDGTNLSRVIADPENDNFVELMGTSTNSAPSIVGHTTISNPSWTAIFTGAWDNKTGVINNVYTPGTYDRWPTVFTQLETYDPDIKTKAITDWDVTGAIAASGSVRADEIVYITQVPGDDDWSMTDAAVTDEAVKSILGEGGREIPNFLALHLIQVDENGHRYGGDSEEYKLAVRRTDENLGAILEAVRMREEATGCGRGADTCEDWTVIVVTDHGHQPQRGFGHGFQSPDETETFVIVDGPQFGDSVYNPDYEIVDVTPTVLSLFGAPECRNCDGVPLMSLRGSDSDPVTQEQLQDLLKAQIAANDYPNIVTNVALSLRTVTAFLPYFVFEAGLPTPLHEILYVVTNIPAQLVALATGVSGAQLFPLLPPPPASSFIPPAANDIDPTLFAACGDDPATAELCIAS